jgi:hypothetical protein
MQMTAKGPVFSWKKIAGFPKPREGHKIMRYTQLFHSFLPSIPNCPSMSLS